MVAQVLRPTFGNDSLLALVEHNDTVGEGIDTVQFMGDNHKGHSESFAKPKDESIELGRSYRIQSRGRLIEKEHRGIKRHRSRNRGAFLHTAADLGGQVTAKALQSYQFEFHPRNDIACLNRQPGELLEGQTYVLLQCHRSKKRSALIGNAKTTQNFLSLRARSDGKIVALDENFPRDEGKQPDQMFQQSTLTTARPTQNDKNFSALHLERDILQDHVISVSRRQPSH